MKFSLGLSQSFAAAFTGIKYSRLDQVKIVKDNL